MHRIVFMGRFLNGTFLIVLFGCYLTTNAQRIYYKQLNDSILNLLPDSTKKVRFFETDSLRYRAQINYILRFYPTLNYNSISIKAINSQKPLDTRPTFFSIFKRAEKRDYIIYVSKGTLSPMDSILPQHLTLNSQVGAFAHEISHIYDFSTSHVFQFISLFLNRHSQRKMRDFEYSTDKLTIEQGLGYPLLTWAKEVREKLKIENWKTVKGYDFYKQTIEDRRMPPETIQHFMSDFPVYLQNQYK